MAYDKVVDSTVLDNGLKSIADAIRAKAGVGDSFAFPTDFVNSIFSIETGGKGISVRAYGTIIPSADQTENFEIDTGIKLVDTNKICVLWINKGETAFKGTLLYTSQNGLTVVSGKTVSAGYRGGANKEIYETSGAGIKTILNTQRIVLGGVVSANFSYGLKAGFEYLWFVME